MPQIWTCHVSCHPVNESCRISTYAQTLSLSASNTAVRYEWAKPHLWISHVSRHTYKSKHAVFLPTPKHHLWLRQSRWIWINNATHHLNESCHIHQWVMSHIWMSHLTIVKWITPNTWMRHVTHVYVTLHIWINHAAFLLTPAHRLWLFHNKQIRINNAAHVNASYQNCRRHITHMNGSGLYTHPNTASDSSTASR